MPDAKSKQELLNRLRTIEGHIRGIQKMVDGDAYCIDVITQTQAIQAALEKFNAGLLESHLSHCVTTAIQGSDAKERERVLGELMTVFSHGAARRAPARRSK